MAKMSLPRIALIYTSGWSSVGYRHRSVTLLYMSLAAWGVIPGIDLVPKALLAVAAIIVVTISLLCLGLWAFVNHQEHTHNDHSIDLRDLTP